MEYEEERVLEQNRAEAAKREAATQAEIAKAHQQREAMLHAIKITNARIKCLGSCSFRTLEFVVTNTSQNPINGISFGWMIPPPQMRSCLDKLATKERRPLVLQPGETAPMSIYITDAPDQDNSRFCLVVTEVNNGGVFGFLPIR